MTLRYRLLASYILLIVIALLTAALPILFLLRHVPAPREEALGLLRNSMDEYGALTHVDHRRFQPEVIRLLELAGQDYATLFRFFGGMEPSFERSILADRLPAISLPNLPGLREKSTFTMESDNLERLAHSVERMGYRLIVTAGMNGTDDDQSPVVWFDSRKHFMLGDTLKEFHLDGPHRGGESLGRERFTSTFGDFRDSAGEQWVFYGMNWRWPFGQSLLPQGITVLLAEERPSQWEVLQRPLLRSFAVSTVVALLLAVWISRSISNPLSAFARAADAVAEGDLDQRVPVSGPPEMQHAAAAFNHMSVQVKTTQRSQQDLLANISHDLKTPLTSIQGYSQAIVDGATSDVSQAASIIQHEAKRLNRMVTGLLTLSRLGANAAQDAFQEASLALILQRVCQQQQIAAEQCGIELNCSSLGEEKITCDVDLIEQAVMNLVSNALQFTPRGGWVKVRQEKREKAIRIIVEDSGPGVPAEQRERIFERFYQMDPTRGPGRGTGLGLSIVREIALAHEGKVWVEAGSTGGARFVMELPA
ncbi:MAG: HAMP domain-containing sensor histidine kinase [Anaerolineaceae bacterium]|nr:HAMP domain-containing sensor histidine kinase [Anaerolineaceae bacterium]